MDERAAITKLQQGDIDGLDILVQHYQLPALHAAYLICRDYTLAEDIVQNAFLHAYECISSFDPRRPFGPWFLRSVMNSTLTALSAAGRHRDLSWDAQMGEDFDLPSVAPSLQQMLEAAETREEVLAALERLSPGQHVAVVMRYYLDFSDAEIAARLQVPAGTVRRRLHDAHQRLRHFLPV